MPIYYKYKGQHGYVSIQGDPINDEDVDLIVKESLDNRKLGENICCKIPTTHAGIKAMEQLVPRGVPLNATEIFAISQMISISTTAVSLPRRTNGARTITGGC